MRNSDHDAWNGDRDCSSAGGIDTDGVAVSSDLDRRGREVPDSTPLAPPIGFSSGPSLADFVQRMIRQEVSARAAELEMETFEEADDFEVEDDPLDPLTPYEAVFEPPKPVLTAEEYVALRDGAATPKMTAQDWELLEKSTGQKVDLHTAKASTSGKSPVSPDPSDPLSRNPSLERTPASSGQPKSGSDNSE